MNLHFSFLLQFTNIALSIYNSFSLYPSRFLSSSFSSILLVFYRPRFLLSFSLLCIFSPLHLYSFPPSFSFIFSHCLFSLFLLLYIHLRPFFIFPFPSTSIVHFVLILTFSFSLFPSHLFSFVFIFFFINFLPFLIKFIHSYLDFHIYFLFPLLKTIPSLFVS